MEKTSDLLGQILTHGPSQNTIFFALTKMKEEGLHSKIIQECLKALSVYPDDIRIRNLLAGSYLEAGFISLAEEALVKLISEIEKLTPAYMLQARIYKQQNRPEKAMESLKKYLALTPRDQEAIDLYEEIAPTGTATTPEAPPLEEMPVEEVTEPTPEEEPLEEIAAPEPEGKNLPEKEETEVIEDEAGEEIVDLATPTLAELYFSQGRIGDAIETYEKVLLNDPEDEKSEQRLNELKASLDKETEPQPSEEPKEINFQKKTEKSISILEDWLTRLQKKS